jgi:cytochrome c oxidase subunit IV
MRKDEAMADVVNQARAVTHIVSARVLVSVWLGLMVLTVITVVVATADSLDLGGKTNLWIAMIIATVKASLVLLYFMHLRYDSALNAMWFIFALFFVALFIVATIGDTRQYQGDLIPGYAPAMTQ